MTTVGLASTSSLRKWRPLVVLSLAQFLMVLDQAVMNVSISQLVEDFATDVTTIQGVITFYSLTMAALMITGGKVGDILGRRRAFTIGHLVYGAGSALTAASWSVGSLVVGWSILEGIGAALVLPALVALIAANYEGSDRIAAFGVIGGVSGVGIAAGPIVGGFFTTNLSWRWVFVGEVVIVLLVVALSRLVEDSPVERRPQLDVVGAALTIVGLGMVVIGALQASTWGWVEPKASPVEPFGFALTPFVAAGGVAVLVVFARWQHRREAAGRDPLVRLPLLRIAPVRAGLGCFLAQNTILLGIFFTLPLYFQIVLGFDALQTGVRMLPISIAMLLASMSGPALAARFSPRGIVRAGFLLMVVAAFLLLGQIRPSLDGLGNATSLVVLGIAMGLVASQLGNVVQSSVGAADRGEAGGLQYTAQQLGAALGTALIGALVISALVGAFVRGIQDNPAIPATVTTAIEVEVSDGVSFVGAEQVDEALRAAGLDDPTTAEVVAAYGDAQLRSLRAGLLLAAFIALGALGLTSGLPSRSGAAAAEDRDAGDDETRREHPRTREPGQRHQRDGRGRQDDAAGDQ